eukprot:CAMPEP_0183707870 /NCGR_PEP_ID=MMETSP0737-20130205/4295_1 /TAXON_ID=385413 /ORGANISM="Thalassiosira miniscula, Strain CCMP1093" /LENGTH=367 /DNA_ID=CAMNT_0025935603 /DNA_START=338 /DNA_END=1441 /DNA_ORIENTATION=+
MPPPEIKIQPNHGGSIEKVNDHDVILGRGGRVNRNPGNVNFRSIVKEYEDEYRQALRLDKVKIAARLVDRIRGADPSGRFLREDSHNLGVYYEVGDPAAWKKAQQALREDPFFDRIAKEKFMLKRKEKNDDVTSRDRVTTPHSRNMDPYDIPGRARNGVYTPWHVSNDVFIANTPSNSMRLPQWWVEPRPNFVEPLPNFVVLTVSPGKLKVRLKMVDLGAEIVAIDPSSNLYGQAKPGDIIAAIDGRRVVKTADLTTNQDNERRLQVLTKMIDGWKMPPGWTMHSLPPYNPYALSPPIWHTEQVVQNSSGQNPPPEKRCETIVEKPPSKKRGGGGGSVISLWECDICSNARFKTYEDCEAHEKVCTG